MSHISSSLRYPQYEYEQASLPGILGFIQNQMGQESPTLQRNPPARGSFAAFYEPQEDVKGRKSSIARSESSEEGFDHSYQPLDPEDTESVQLPVVIQKRRETIKHQEGRYEAHRKACRIQETHGLVETPLRVPRDAQTEKRCQMFSVFVTLISLLAIFFFAMTKPVWTTTIQADHYKGLCDVQAVIPIDGTSECTSVRSRESTEVKCVITCTNGINSEETDESFTLNADGKSFNMTCGKTKESWTYDVNKICIPSS